MNEESFSFNKFYAFVCSLDYKEQVQLLTDFRADIISDYTWFVLNDGPGANNELIISLLEFYEEALSYLWNTGKKLTLNGIE